MNDRTPFEKMQFSFDRSLGRVDAIRTRLDHFQGFVGPSRPLTEIFDETLDGFYRFLLAKIASQDAAPAHCKGIMQVVTQFLKDCRSDKPPP